MNDSTRQIDANCNIVGHTWAVDLLRQQVGRGEARQAYLLTGPPGIGRRTLALRFAQALNCETPRALGLPCGTCYHCTHLETDIDNLLLAPGKKFGGGHPDLRVVQPVPANLRPEEEEAMEPRLDLRPDRASLNLKVDQVRRANLTMSMKPYAAQHRILLFVRELFQPSFRVEQVERLDILAESPKFAEVGIPALFETAFLMERR